MCPALFVVWFEASQHHRSEDIGWDQVSMLITEAICLPPARGLRMNTPNKSTTSFYDLREGHCCLLPPQETLLKPVGRSAQVPMKSLLLLCVPVCMRLCVHPLSLAQMIESLPAMQETQVLSLGH